MTWLLWLWMLVVREVAILDELVDRRETYIFSQVENFDDDLQTLQRRWESLQHAPHMESAWWLPPYEVSLECVDTNRKHQSWMYDHLDFTNDQAWVENVLTELRCRATIWNTVRDAKCPYYYNWVRRQELISLKRLLGDEAWYAYRLPSHIPTEWYAEP